MPRAAPDPEDYHRAYAGVQRAADADVLRLLRDAYKDVNRQIGRLATQRGTGVDVRRSQLLAIKKSILENQAEVFARTGKVIQRRRVEAAARAIQVMGRYDEFVFALGGREQDAQALTESLEETEVRAIDVAIARMTGSATPLSRRVYRTQAWNEERLERRINSALARGLNAQEFAREIRDFVNPRTPGGTRYAAMRLARTEINNAFHAIQIHNATMKPWVKGLKWHLSDSHPRTDECNELDGNIFSPEETPKKPHPQCLCYVTPEVNAEGEDPEDDDAFLDALVGGQYDGFLDEFAARHNL